MDNQIKEKLIDLSENKYKDFSSALVPNSENMLGVRLPILRSLAKEIAKSDWRAVLSAGNDIYFEETMLRGMIIGYAKMDINERLDYIKAFVPSINNWSVCDSFCATLKFVDKYKSEMWAFILPYLNSTEEFEIRFAVSLIIDHFICDEYIDDILIKLNGINHDGYYVKMAVAWAISVCFVKFPDKTMPYLKKSDLDDFTYNKALQKIIESYRVDDDTKNIVRSMKRKS